MIPVSIKSRDPMFVLSLMEAHCPNTKTKSLLCGETIQIPESTEDYRLKFLGSGNKKLYTFKRTANTLMLVSVANSAPPVELVLFTSMCGDPSKMFCVMCLKNIYSSLYSTFLTARMYHVYDRSNKAFIYNAAASTVQLNAGLYNNRKLFLNDWCPYTNCGYIPTQLKTCASTTIQKISDVDRLILNKKHE